MPTHLDRVSWLYRQIAASARLSVPLGWRTVDGEALRHQDGVLDVRGERKAGPRRVDNKEGVAEQPPEPPLGQIPARWRQTSRAAAHAVRAATAAVMHCGCRKPERRVRPTKAGPASPISSASNLCHPKSIVSLQIHKMSHLQRILLQTSVQMVVLTSTHLPLRSMRMLALVHALSLPSAPARYPFRSPPCRSHLARTHPLCVSCQQCYELITWGRP